MTSFEKYEVEYKKRLQYLTKELNDILKFVERTDISFESKKPEYDQMINIVKEMQELDTRHKEILLKEMKRKMQG